MLPQQYCLRWRYHHSNLQTMFSQLLEREAFCDVTLACEGRTIKAHKIVLSACSTYFETILSQYEEKDPILIMKDVKYIDIKCLVEFMYKGEINVEHCHLATLLKTAEELRIKGLAEVSWRDEEQTSNNDTSSNGVQTAIPQVQTVMPNSPTSSLKRKRGRPPIDDYDQTFTTPKIMTVSGGTTNQDDAYSNDAMSSSEHDLNIWDEDQSANEGADNTETEDPPVKIKKESNDEDEVTIDDRSNTSFSANESKEKLNVGSFNKSSTSNSNVTTSGNQSFLTPALEKEWPDVIKMNDYLNTGRRQQFWEEPFTKRVMDAIKTKNLEMKVAAELLGVSYGTLYGRYRDSYGCLKHPYRVRDFWTEQGPTDVLLKLKRKEITLFRAAEQLNVTPQTLSNYLISMSQMDTSDANSSRQSVAGESYDDSDDENDSVLPDVPSNNSNVFKNLVTTSNPSGTSSSLANCPDITIVKKERSEGGKINNNSDHSESNSDQSK
ncbi:protein tramtrack, alpha isoform-like [Diorhabda carinulata]|uniref:protein tramtrack, alpha isoform-like n=1 Tax=Diorhabda sublineata TaxID=1163346 RepID=UPI0024E07DF8|nr:protein tramtrack, alpha isoform-like [Diorhabda sublineata]XP_057670935.1 protein tramtrack, alpha isoform-like [Diorhabda carinulata]XP_057670936.1 protein tramtrack, alpha isoform-like [Diorhabda carinulata]